MGPVSEPACFPRAPDPGQSARCRPERRLERVNLQPTVGFLWVLLSISISGNPRTPMLVTNVCVYANLGCMQAERDKDAELQVAGHVGGPQVGGS